MIRSLDLFTGSGSTALALRDIVRPVLYCDIDPFVQNHLLRLIADRCLPDAPLVTDIRTVNSSLSNVDRFDIVIGGAPCIGHSSMGLKQGFVHPETKLFFEMMNVIAMNRPPIVILENTPNILKPDQFQQVIEIFNTLDYSLCWSLVYAYEVGSPQNRRRWFCIAHRNSARAKSLMQKLFFALSKSADPNNWQKEPVPRMTRTKQFAYTKRSALLGNAIVPQQLRFAILRIVGWILQPSQRFQSLHDRFPAHGIAKKGRVFAVSGTEQSSKPNLGLILRDDSAHSGSISSKCIALWPTPRAKNYGHCLHLTARCSLDLATAVRFEQSTKYVSGDRINLAWVEWLMGFPPGWTDPNSKIIM